MPAEAAPRGMPRAVFFDFDGVVLESAQIKTEAFRDLYAHLPEHLPKILEYHQRHLGVSRFVKFDWVHQKLLGRPLATAERRELGERYSRLVLDKMLRCPAVPGALELLRDLREATLAFVVSATPQEELELIVERRELTPFFHEVHGSPATKPEIVRDLLLRHGLPPADTVFIGDGLSDYDAAAALGVPFILRETEEQREHFRRLRPRKVTDLHGLRSLLGVGP